MNREILFRGKKVGSGQWVYGYLTKPINAGLCIVDYLTGLTWEVDPATVGQFTGRLDPKEKKIFEGDVMREEIELEIGDERYFYICTWINEWACFAWLTPHERQDYLKYGEIKLDEPLFFTYRLTKENKGVVCGNIHDQPNYLKGYTQSEFQDFLSKVTNESEIES